MMFVFLSFIICVTLFTSCVLSTSDMQSKCGKAALWNPAVADKASSLSSNDKYITKTAFVSQVNEHLDNVVPNSEVVVMFKPSSKDDQSISTFQYPSIQNSIKASDKSFCYLHVYQDEKATNTANKIASSSSTSSSSSSSQRFSLRDFVQMTKKQQEESSSPSSSSSSSSSNIFNNNQIDIVEVELNQLMEDVVNSELLQELFDMMSQQQSKSTISYLAIDQPSLNAIAPEKHAEYSNNNKRRLDDSTVSYIPTNSSIYYEPEGTEFSIYYADTYLYITPDIFTGIMTSLFVVGVLLTGFSCLNAVQGASSFVMKPIPLGKEY